MNEQAIFKGAFVGCYVVEGDRVTTEHEGFTITATAYRDTDADRPDEMGDGFWPSLDPNDAGYIGDGKGDVDLQRAQAKAEDVMTAWEGGEWFYCGVAVTVERAGVQLTGQYANALWGVECNYPGSDNAYLCEVANDLTGEALSAARAKLAELCTCSEPAKEEPEAREFAFDVKLFASIRVKATTEEGARAQLRQLLDCASVVIEPLDGNHDFSDLQRFECSADGEADLVEVEDEDSQA